MMSIAQPKLKVRPRLKRPGLIEEIVRTVIFVVVVTILFDMAIPRSLVDGRSMQPTFYDGERLVVSRLHFLATRPARGDVIVFNSLDPHEVGIMLIKRVIGLPGDKIEFRNQDLYINDVFIDEDYTFEECRPYQCSDKVWELGENEYFVMGDNRNNSRDSRIFGPVPLDHIVGRVVFRYWPFPRLGAVRALEYPNTTNNSGMMP